MSTCPTSLKLALDRSLRSVDADGHLRVEESRISKANVCPYKGSEIPNSKALGLDPNKIYRLYRDPGELRQGATTFEGKPLLIRHVPINAELPSKELWVGTIGKVTYEHPYLVTRPLMVLTQEAIDLIESEEQRELSAGYRYEAIMGPGNADGQDYDGRMVNIRGNHVAIVGEGRAGHDVHVADESPPEFRSMKKTPKVITLVSQLLRSENPSVDDVRLALDAALGETPAKSVISLDESEKKEAEAKAQDAKRKRGSDDDLTDAEREEAHDEAREGKEEAHDAKESAEDAAEEKADKDKDDEEAKDRKGARDARKGARDSRKGARDKRANDRKRAHDAAGHVSAQNMDKKAKDAKGAADKKAADALPDKDDHRNDFRSGDSVTKDEMSAAIKAAIATTKASERAAAQAREAVRPVVGAIDIAMDSAEKIYGFALKSQGVELDGVPEAAYAALFGAIRKTASPAPPMAMDSSGVSVDRKTLLGLN